MKLSHIKADFATKQAEDESKFTRLADIRKRAEAQKTGTGGVDWTRSAFCDEGKHGACGWRECKCDCHRHDSAMNDMFGCYGRC